MIIRRIGVWSVAKLYGAMMAVFGLFGGALFALAATAGGMAGAMNADASARGAGMAFGGLSALFGVGAIIILPICYGVMGLIIGAISAGLYNLFAGMFGGIELEIQQ